jgi:hypothetical protein
MVNRVNSSMIYLIYYRKFYKCHNVPPPSTIINNVLKKRPSINFFLVNEKQNTWSGGETTRPLLGTNFLGS